VSKEQTAVTWVPLYFDGDEARTVAIDGEVHFVGNDVCKRLGYTNTSKAMTDHCKGITKRYPLYDPERRAHVLRSRPIGRAAPHRRQHDFGPPTDSIMGCFETSCP
jgi:prophage antirepressor-like protein